MKGKIKFESINTDGGGYGEVSIGSGEYSFIVNYDCYNSYNTLPVNQSLVDAYETIFTHYVNQECHLEMKG